MHFVHNLFNKAELWLLGCKGLSRSMSLQSQQELARILSYCAPDAPSRVCACLSILHHKVSQSHMAQFEVFILHP